MSVIGSNILAGASGQAGYNLTKSLRFRSSASAYLNRTPASAGNRTTWTLSFWCKRGLFGGDKIILSAGTTGSTDVDIFFPSDQFMISDRSGWQLKTTQVFRDPSAWYHFVVAFDTTQATSTNRIKMYVNGSQITDFSGPSYPAQNATSSISNNVPQYIGTRSIIDNLYDGYLTEVNFIDGQALTPSSFGETSTTTGVWIPKKYTGTYGTNGFYLKFTDTTSTSTLGTDFSGNSNTWTVNNISLTAGVTYDSMTDVPTLTSLTAANYCVLNPLDIFYNTATTTVTNGNLTFTASATSGGASVRASMALTSSKFYYEAVLTSSITSSSTQTAWGLATSSYASSWGGTGSWGIVLNDSSIRARRIFNQGTTTNITDNTNVTATAILQCFVDTSTGNAWFGINNTWYDSSGGTTGNPSAGTNPTVTSVSGTVFPYLWAYGQNPSINFGQRPFSYTPPSGFVALNTFNLPTPTIGATASTTANKYMDATTYTGNGGTQAIVNAGAFKPDFVWMKKRSSAESHILQNSIAGTTKFLISNSTATEDTSSAIIQSFDTNGFTVGASSVVNGSATTYVGWQWRASNATAVTNTAGSITSTVSASTTAGFSIVTYTGTGANATVGHGLGVTPSMILLKCRTVAHDWRAFHGSFTSGDSYLRLNTTAATASSSTIWNGTLPTSSVFSVGTDGGTNQSSQTFVAYCFSAVAGYSAFGSYTGNGSSDGTFVYTGFRPKFVMVKRSSGIEAWTIRDTSRNTYNVANLELQANSSGAEGAAGGLDLLSNGFKCRAANNEINASGTTYIYMAFAENPFKYANAR